MIQQICTYDVVPALRQRMLARFRDHALPIMRERYGFSLAWMGFTADWEKTRFVYLLRWESRSAMTEAWSRFLDDGEWRAELARSRNEHGEPVISVEDVVVDVIEDEDASVSRPGMER